MFLGRVYEHDGWQRIGLKSVLTIMHDCLGVDNWKTVMICVGDTHVNSCNALFTSTLYSSSKYVCPTPSLRLAIRSIPVLDSPL